MPSSSTPVAPVQNELVGLTDLVLTRAPTALNPTGVTVALPNVPLDPAWDFETLRGHLRDHGHALRPDESTTIHLAHAQNDLERAIRTLDVHDALRVMDLPGLRASNDLLNKVLDLDLEKASPVVPMTLGERMAAQETLVTLFLAGGARPSTAGWNLAAQNGNPRLLARLLEARLEPLTKGKAYGLLLYVAQHNGWSSGTWAVNRLLDAGAYLNPQSVAQAATPPKPPLSVACQAGNLARVEDLLNRGADPNAPRPDGAPPLHSAFELDHPDLAMRLLRAGANLHADVPFKGLTVFEDAVLRGAPKCVQRLLDDGIDPLLPSPGFEANPGPYGTALLDRLLDLRQQRLSMAEPFGLSAAAMDSLILLEAHGLKRAMAASTAESTAPKRRL